MFAMMGRLEALNFGKVLGLEQVQFLFMGILDHGLRRPLNVRLARAARLLDGLTKRVLQRQEMQL